METIIETIISNREELICKYSKLKKDIEALSVGIKQAIKLEKEDVTEKLWVKREELEMEATNINMAINELGNALNHLGERTEIYWG